MGNGVAQGAGQESLTEDEQILAEHVRAARAEASDRLRVQADEVALDEVAVILAKALLIGGAGGVLVGCNTHGNLSPSAGSGVVKLDVLATGGETRQNLTLLNQASIGGDRDGELEIVPTPGVFVESLDHGLLASFHAAVAGQAGFASLGVLASAGGLCPA